MRGIKFWRRKLCDANLCFEAFVDDAGLVFCDDWRWREVEVIVDACTHNIAVEGARSADAIGPCIWRDRVSDCRARIAV